MKIDEKGELQADAMDDVEQDRKQVLFMLCTPAGNA